MDSGCVDEGAVQALLSGAFQLCCLTMSPAAGLCGPSDDEAMRQPMAAALSVLGRIARRRRAAAAAAAAAVAATPPGPVDAGAIAGPGPGLEQVDGWLWAGAGLVYPQAQAEIARALRASLFSPLLP